MSASNLQNQYNVVCARLGEVEYRLSSLQAEKAVLLKQAQEIQKAHAAVVAANAPEKPEESTNA